MDFDYTDEQRLLADNVERLMREHCGDAARRAIRAGAEGWSRELWARYGDMGLLALPFPETDGGIGGSAVETMIVMEAFGQGVTTEPYLASIILAGGLVAEAGSAAQRARLLPGIMDGGRLAAFALDDGPRAVSARRDGTAWVIAGVKRLVLHGDAADGLVVAARTGDGSGLFWVDARAAGLRRDNYRLVDGRGAADVTFNDLRVGPEDVLGDPLAASSIIARIVDRALAALAAESAGTMAAVHRMTVEYLKTRAQFGTVIGRFQALQHRAAEMLVALEQARSMMLFGAMMADHPEADERRRALAAVKVQMGRSARLIAQQAVQLHGAIGVTEEYALSHYVRRLTVNEMLFGDTEFYVAQLAADGGLFAAEA